MKAPRRPVRRRPSLLRHRRQKSLAVVPPKSVWTQLRANDGYGPQVGRLFGKRSDALALKDHDERVARLKLRPLDAAARFMLFESAWHPKHTGLLPCSYVDSAGFGRSCEGHAFDAEPPVERHVAFARAAAFNAARLGEYLTTHHGVYGCHWMLVIETCQPLGPNWIELDMTEAGVGTATTHVEHPFRLATPTIVEHGRHPIPGALLIQAAS